MADDPLDRVPAYDRVSIPAVLVEEDEDPAPALAAAGILEPIAIPVVLGEELDLSAGILGDGVTPNLIGVLELQPEGVSDSLSDDQVSTTDSPPDATSRAESVTTSPRLAFGQRSFAPIRQNS